MDNQNLREICKFVEKNPSQNIAYFVMRTGKEKYELFVDTTDPNSKKSWGIRLLKEAKSIEINYMTLDSFLSWANFISIDEEDLIFQLKDRILQQYWHISNVLKEISLLISKEEIEVFSKNMEAFLNQLLDTVTSTLKKTEPSSLKFVATQTNNKSN